MNKELETEIYPVTILLDRYGGTYSGGEWLALNEYSQHVPHEISSNDVVCFEFWINTTQIIGKGDTPNEALKDLLNKLNK